jgi:hypothetical protein
VDTGSPDELPWWAQARARIALLLLTLLAAGGTAVLATATLGPASADDGCWIEEGPPPIWLRPAVVTAAVRRLGLVSLPAPGARPVHGLSTPDAALSGAAPEPTAPRTGLVPAGYEVRWRSSRGERFGVAAYRFSSGAAAAAFVSHASATRCRPGTAAQASAEPPGARTLTQQGAAAELDLFFHRGATGYWLFATPARGTGLTQADHTALGVLACRLTEAHCSARRI